jgi:hypothetical protein
MGTISFEEMFGGDNSPEVIIANNFVETVHAQQKDS